MLSVCPTVYTQCFKYSRTCVYSGHCVQQPPPYYSHLAQAPCGKPPCFFKAATSLLQPLIVGARVIVRDRLYFQSLANCFLPVLMINLCAVRNVLCHYSTLATPRHAFVSVVQYYVCISRAYRLPLDKI